jgi:hypothetical protein
VASGGKAVSNTTLGESVGGEDTYRSIMRFCIVFEVSALGSDMEPSFSFNLEEAWACRLLRVLVLSSRLGLSDLEADGDGEPETSGRIMTGMGSSLLAMTFWSTMAKVPQTARG